MLLRIILKDTYKEFINSKLPNPPNLDQLLHCVYLCLIFEMSIWEFIKNSKKNRFRNTLNFLSSSNLIFAGYTGSKNQVRTRQEIEFVSKSIFF